MTYVLRCWGYATGAPCEHVGQFLEWYDPEKPAEETMGGWTRDLDRAKKFPTQEAAVQEWRRIRRYAGGKRPDGEPDRPLTAYNVEIMHYLEAANMVRRA